MSEKEQSRRPGRLRAIPPAPAPRPPSELLAIDDEALAVFFWRAVRDTVLWARTPRAARTGLFRPMGANARERLVAACGAAPELHEALEALARFQSGEAAMDRHNVAATCHAVYAWAERRAMIPTAMHFAEATALAEPGNAAWAVDAGWICRKAGGEFMTRSAAWYERAFVLGVRTKNRKDTIRALTGYGALMQDLGNREEARRAYERAARRAHRTGRHRQAAVSWHYLFALAAESDELAEAVECARKALALYPQHDVRLPALAHDLAFLLVRHGHYELAHRLAERASAAIDRPDELTLVLSTVARAAACAGHADAYAKAERAALSLAERHAQYAAAAHVNAAEGARALLRWDRAEELAEAAMRIARDRNDPVPEQAACILREQAHARVPIVPATDPAPGTPVARLARRLVARLRRWRRRAAGASRH